MVKSAIHLLQQWPISSIRWTSRESRYSSNQISSQQYRTTGLQFSILGQSHRENWSLCHLNISQNSMKLCLRFIRKCVDTLSNNIKLRKIWYLDEFGFWFILSVPEDDKDLRSPWSFMNLTMTSNIVRNGSGSSCTKRQNVVNDSEDRHTIHPNICFSFTSIDTENKTQQNQWHFHNMNANVAWYNVDGSLFIPRNFVCFYNNST